MDAGYSNLLAYLHNDLSTNSTPTEQLAASTAFYLAGPLNQVPSPAALVAAVVRSTVWRPFTLSTCTILRDAFVHATLVKHGDTSKESSTIFSRSHGSKLDEWIQEVRRGMDGGPAFIRLVCLSGIIKGIAEAQYRTPKLNIHSRGVMEDELVSTLSMVLRINDQHEAWGIPDMQDTKTSQDLITLSLIMTAEPLQSVPSVKLRNLDFTLLSSQLLTSIVSAFSTPEGTFLSRSLAYSAFDQEKRLHYPPISPITNDIAVTIAKPSFVSVAPLSKLLAYIIACHAEFQSAHYMKSITRLMDGLNVISSSVAKDWARSPFAEIEKEENMTPPTRELATHVWTILKTLLFLNIMVSQSILSATVYAPFSVSTSTASSTLAYLSFHVLSSFRSLSFVISQFGGISTSAGSGFPELKRAAYIALDLLSADAIRSTRFLEECITEETTEGIPKPIRRAQVAFSLTCAEQLVPVLSEEFIRNTVICQCIPYLDNPTHRDVYESAHSVVLAILENFASRNDALNPKDAQLSAIARQLIPFYLKCLMENSKEDRLNDEQLRLAYAALIHAATNYLKEPHVESNAPADALPWYCFDTLISTLRSCTQNGDTVRARRLLLAFISGLPGLSLALTARALGVLAELVDELEVDNLGRRKVLEAIYEEFLRNLGDSQKDYAMHWWHEHRMTWTKSGVVKGVERHGEL